MTAGATTGSAPAHEEHRVTELDSGVRVVTQAVPSVRSVALGFYLGVGSRHETPAEAGLTHFLEHLLFKGTDRWSSTEIDEIFDAMGAEINAGTGKETTSLYARFLDQHLERAFEVMSDMVLRPTYPDVDSERQVVIEEIAMYEDEPSDKVHDVMADALFGDHPLGRPVIGTAEVIGSVPIPQVAAYHDARYVPRSTVVAAAGNVDHERIVELVAAQLGEPGPPASVPEAAPPGNGAVVRFHQKSTEQYHLCLGGRGIPPPDERRHALRVLDTLLGGSTSSRLFQEVRERRGLAYSVFSYSGSFMDAGQVGVYVGTRPDNVREAMDVIGAELSRLRSEPIGEEELARAKENVKGRVVLSMESTMARMNRLGGATILGVPLLTLDETIAALDAVSLEDVTALAQELFDPARLSAAGVGTDEDVFRSALEAVNPALAAA
ncbi:MAG: M16 family metallopeptidase [Thermoleophilaceae bacterium]